VVTPLFYSIKGSEIEEKKSVENKGSPSVGSSVVNVSGGSGTWKPLFFAVYGNISMTRKYIGLSGQNR
jgi:hypothetical protein